MRRIVLARNLAWTLAAVLLIAASISASPWFALLAPAMLGVFWYLLRSLPLTWRSSAVLGGYAGLAAAGMVVGLTEVTLLLGVVAALAAWDLTSLAGTLAVASSPGHLDRIERMNLRALSLAVGLGLLLALLALFARLDLPFIAVGALALGLLASLTRLAQQMRAMRR